MAKHKYALKWGDTTIYQTCNAPGKRDGLSQVVIRIYNRKHKPSLTLPVYDQHGRPLKGKRDFFIEGQFTDGAPLNELAVINARIKEIQVETLRHFKRLGLITI